MGVVKKWWWLILIGIAIAGVIRWEEARGLAQAYQCRAAYLAQLQSENSALPRSTVYQQASEQQAIAAACEPSDYFYRLFSPANLPTMLLFFVGIGGVWAALRTLKAIEKQADALIDSECARVVIELVPICTMFGNRWHRQSGANWVELSQIELMSGYYLRQRLKVTNLGRTAAIILECEIRYSYLAEGKPNIRFLPEVIGAMGGNESFERPEIDIYSMRNDLIKNDGDSKNLVRFDGFLRYQHVFSETEVAVASFAYIYNPDDGFLKRVARPQG